MKIHFWPLLKRITASRPGWFLFVVHLCLIAHNFDWHFADFSHAHEDCISSAELKALGPATVCVFYTPLSLIITTLLDLPAIMLVGIFTFAFDLLLPNACSYTSDQFGAVAFLLCASAQWWLAGYGFQRLYQRSKDAR
ncbi:MAG: hypothetical protein LC742_09680 [Acidobacteria bacterium]|nr:hypothetical protein [Acidobacteriota bacterium]